LKTRIWFNHWFNSAYHFIDLIRNNADNKEFEFFGTNENINSSVLQNCDYSEQEPVLNNQEYIDYCIDFCKRNSIDVFVPRRNMLEIVKNIKLFDDAGVKVLAERDANLIKTVNDKSLFYDVCKQNGLTQIPEYYIVSTPQQFLTAYKQIISHGNIACFKPVSGEGASGFRVIRSMANSIEWLLSPVNHRLSIEQVMKILEKYDTFPEIMILEYLQGYEYSVDCLSYEKNLLASVQRKKIDSRQRAIVFSEEVDEYCKRIFEIFPMSYVSNIQIKYNGNVLKILEVNPRMSGGLHISCHSGINFPYLAIKLLLDKTAEVNVPSCNITFTQIEKEILISR
jgi:predicted ATP-grasp superfamily ATP-dependent carboligase